MVLHHLIFHRVTAGVDGAMFIATGLLAFFLFRNTALRSMDAVNANSALFAYRQVLPVDTVLVRAALEGFLTCMVALVLLSGASLLGFTVMPDNGLLVLAAAAALWVSGIGLGLTFSVIRELVPEFSKLVNMLLRPLYFLSGIMFAAMAIPQPYRDWMLYNPLLHGIESVHAGFFAQFYPASGVSLAYIWGFALLTVFLGLALHIRFAQRMVAQ